MFREGSQVIYTGWHGKDGVDVGDIGKILSYSDKASHVLLTTGAASGKIMFLYNDDLVSKVSTSMMEVDDSLDEGGFSTVAVRQTYDDFGVDGLLNALSAEGQLNTFEGIAEQTLQFVASQIRNDPAVRIALSQLDDDEANEFVNHATAVLLRDAFDEVE